MTAITAIMLRLVRVSRDDQEAQTCKGHFEKQHLSSRSSLSSAVVDWLLPEMAVILLLFADRLHWPATRIP
jgi:hypothetical protein